MTAPRRILPRMRVGPVTTNGGNSHEHHSKGDCYRCWPRHNHHQCWFRWRGEFSPAYCKCSHADIDRSYPAFLRSRNRFDSAAAGGGYLQRRHNTAHQSGGSVECLAERWLRRNRESDRTSDRCRCWNSHSEGAGWYGLEDGDSHRRKPDFHCRAHRGTAARHSRRDSRRDWTR